jgi:hypothetical protein
LADRLCKVRPAAPSRRCEMRGEERKGEEKKRREEERRGKNRKRIKK